VHKGELQKEETQPGGKKKKREKNREFGRRADDPARRTDPAGDCGEVENPREDGRARRKNVRGTKNETRQPGQNDKRPITTVASKKAPG